MVHSGPWSGVARADRWFAPGVSSSQLGHPASRLPFSCLWRVAYRCELARQWNPSFKRFVAEVFLLKAMPAIVTRNDENAAFAIGVVNGFHNAVHAPIVPRIGGNPCTKVPRSAVMPSIFRQNRANLPPPPS
jgi:hypothetical protein